MYLVVWSHIDRTGENELIDGWLPFESLEAASAAYEAQLAHPDLFIVSLAGVIRSTDYDAAPTQKE